MATAKTKTAPPVEAPEAPATAAVQTPEHLRDVVAMPSLRADGTPDQTTGFVTLIDEPLDVED